LWGPVSYAREASSIVLLGTGSTPYIATAHAHRASAFQHLDGVLLVDAVVHHVDASAANV
jgi:hypothetical protein